MESIDRYIQKHSDLTSQPIKKLQQIKKLSDKELSIIEPHVVSVLSEALKTKGIEFDSYPTMLPSQRARVILDSI